MTTRCAPALRLALLTALGLATTAAAMAEDQGGDAPGATPRVERATFAGGCFWCLEADFDHVDGVLATTSGYAGGHVDRPTYEQVSEGGTGHAESVQVLFDPSRVSYRELLDVFWHSVDPTDAGGQFCDRGSQYRTEIFTETDDQRRLAEESKVRVEASKPFEQPIVTAIVPLRRFWPAEEHHQDYHDKHPWTYRYYRSRCGRDARVRQLWGHLAGRASPPGAEEGR